MIRPHLQIPYICELRDYISNTEPGGGAILGELWLVKAAKLVGDLVELR